MNDNEMNKIKLLEEENNKLRNELIITKEHLKKYTSPLINNTEYGENKEKHKQPVNKFSEKKNNIYNIRSSPLKLVVGDFNAGLRPKN